MSRYLVGLTGGIGSGKSTVADLFAALDVVIVDTDRIAHQLTASSGEALAEIVAAFGDGMLTESGALDRVAMRRLVFTDAAARHRLEAILHPRIALKTMAACEAATSPYVMVVVPLLLETDGWKERFDRILVLDCDEATQIGRVKARNGLTESEIRAIMAAQINRAERLAAASEVIDNRFSQAELIASVKELHRLYLASARQEPA